MQTPYQILNSILRGKNWVIGASFFCLTLLTACELQGTAINAHNVEQGAKSSSFSPTIAKAKQPNIIIFVADQLRTQSMGYYGNPYAQTPNIDRLAAQGIRFDQFVANTPVCSTFRASMLTGKYASTMGMVINEIRLNPNHDTLAHVLNNGGYASGMLGKWHLWANQAGGHNAVRNAYTPPGPYRLGFDDYWAAYNFNHHNYKATYFNDTPKPKRIRGFGPDAYAAMAIDYIKEKSQGQQPFLLTVGFSEPHPPWTRKNLPKKWYDIYKDTHFEKPKNWRADPDPRADRYNEPEWFEKNVVQNYQEISRVYYGMIANLDWNIGRILDSLDEQGIAEDTIVIFTSDHGEQLGSHGRIQKMIFYEESVRIPFVMRWPNKIPAGQCTESLMSTVDIMPTLLGLAEQPIPPQVEGMNLAHIAQGKPGPEKENVLLQGMGHTYLWKNGYEWRALRDGTYTFATYLKDGKRFLFNHRDDPYQQTNLVEQSEFREIAEQYENSLNAKLEEIGDEFLPVTDYKNRWTKNRVILRGAKGEFVRDTGESVAVDVNFRSGK